MNTSKKSFLYAALLFLMLNLAALSPSRAFFFVVDVSPEVAQEGVGIESSVSVTFNKAVNTGTMAGKLYLLYGTEVVPGRLEFDYTSNTLHFIPSRGRHLIYGATYTAVLAADMGSIENETIGSEKRWSFSTEVAVGLLKDFYPYPNPAQGSSVNIHYLLSENMEEVFLEVFDSHRRKLMQRDMGASAGFNNQILQLVDDEGLELPWGLYHLRLRAKTTAGAEVRALSRMVKGK